MPVDIVCLELIFIASQSGIEISYLQTIVLILRL